MNASEKSSPSTTAKDRIKPVKTIAEKLLHAKKRRPTTAQLIRRYRRAARRLVAQFGDLPLTDITPEMLRGLMSREKPSRTPTPTTRSKT